MKVLINTPELSRKGGVAANYRRLRRYFPTNFTYFTTGPRTPVEGLWGQLQRFISDYHNFSKTLRRENWDIVQLNPSLVGKALIRDGIFLLIAKWFQKTVIVFNRGWNLDFEQILHRRWLWLFQWVFFRADAFIVLGSEFREKLIKMGYSNPIYLETTTVDDAYLKNTKSSSSDGRQLSDPFNILFLTRVERYKGIYEALTAYQILKEDFAQARFILAGDGSELGGVRDYVEKHGFKDVEFTGFVRGCAKKKVFDRSHCYLFPSYSEGMPTSVLEAMACGLPVVTRPVGGIKDFFEDEKMGYIVSSFEPSLFAEAMVRLIEEPETCEKISKYNLEYAAKRFTASHVAKRLERIYESVLAVKAENM